MSSFCASSETTSIIGSGTSTAAAAGAEAFGSSNAATGGNITRACLTTLSLSGARKSAGSFGMRVRSSATALCRGLSGGSVAEARVRVTGAAAGKLKTVLSSEAGNSSVAADASSLSSASSVARSGIAPAISEIVSLDGSAASDGTGASSGSTIADGAGAAGLTRSAVIVARLGGGAAASSPIALGMLTADACSSIAGSTDRVGSTLFCASAGPAGRVSCAVSVTRPVVTTAPTTRTPATRIVWP